MLIERLSAAGYKATGPRRRILETLCQAGEPWTAQQVAEQAGTSVASTYRVLALLVELGVVSETEDAGEAGGGTGTEGRSRRYTLCTATGHHHHFVCRSCHATMDVESDALERALAELGGTLGVRLEQHDITLRGQCAQCQNEESA